MATGANVVAEMTAGIVEAVVDAIVEAVEPVVEGGTAAVPHGAIVAAAHEAVSKFLMRPNSLWSIERFQRAFIATHSERYVQVYDFCGGIQLEGSLSDFDLF